MKNNMNNNLTDHTTNTLRAALIAALAAVLCAVAGAAVAAGSGAPGAALSGAMHRGGDGHGGRHAVAGARGLRNAGWGLWGYGPTLYGAPQPAGIAPVADATLTEHVTYTYDVPWDAVHRYPRPLQPYAAAPGCHDEQQTVPRHGGGKQTVNIVRCY